MPLTQDEIKEVTKKIVRCNIDLNQGFNYFLNSNYTEGYANFVAALSSLQEIMKEVHD